MPIKPALLRIEDEEPVCTAALLLYNANRNKGFAAWGHSPQTDPKESQEAPV